VSDALWACMLGSALDLAHNLQILCPRYGENALRPQLLQSVLAPLEILLMVLMAEAMRSVARRRTSRKDSVIAFGRCILTGSQLLSLWCAPEMMMA
jgi:hypothetical protein